MYTESTGGKFVLPKSLFRYAAILSHGLDHGSTVGMVDVIQKIFTVYGFTNYFKTNCLACSVCAQYNPQGQFRPKRGKIPEPQYRFQHIFMDFIELNKCEGMKYCLTIIDMYSKWIDVLPTRNPDALTVAKTLTNHIIQHFGIPEKIYSDNGTHFVNKVIQDLTALFGILLKRHCSYHPQSAGLIERNNGTVKAKLKKMMAETGKTWMRCLAPVMLSMHILPSARGLSPFEMLYGRPYYLPE